MSDAVSPPTALPASLPRLEAIARAEQQRNVGGLADEDQRARDVVVRRAAARALARIQGVAARPGLTRALFDEDLEVVTWAAYGLGFDCGGNERRDVSALVARALSLPPSTTAESPVTTPALTAIARAVGRCAADASEPTLLAWLSAPREQRAAASLALGDLASVHHRLAEDTLAALLAAAAGSAAAPPLPEALYALSRLERVPATVRERLHEVAVSTLARPGEARIFAVRALGRAGNIAAVDLQHVVESPESFTPAERAEAVRALIRLGRGGRRALEAATTTLTGLVVPSMADAGAAGSASDSFAALLLAVNGLTEPGAADKALRELASLPLAVDATGPEARRAAWLRCSSAKVLAGANASDSRLLTCAASTPPTTPESDSGVSSAAGLEIAQRARVEVLGRAPIVGARLGVWRELVSAGELRTREAAVELLATHDELAGGAAVLAKALGAPEPGLVVTAATVIAQHPERAIEQTPRKKRARKKPPSEPHADEPVGAALPPSPAVVKALLAALARPGIEADPELAAALVDAAGALALKEAVPRLRAVCASAWPSDREHASKALSLITGKKEACAAGAALSDPPKELFAKLTAPTTLRFETDAGTVTMRLDPSVAPVATSRVVELARGGYYDGLSVSRVVPGYVTQFGAPLGDGYGGPEDRPPLRCETSPLPFGLHSVGVALSGRDTGSSQLFVTHARYPHLDGQYAWIGTAEGPWEGLVEGDLIHKVTVVD
jgi:cyclophilin family peptidyl-prolyl cis-trans isomerase/HEAT repeat protein